jgi:CubicO group peptidase (beta-lactamase class C family)
MRRWRTDGVAPRRAVAAVLTLLALAAAGGRPDPGFAASPATGPDFSRVKLERIGELFRNEIATRKIPGAILLIQQHGHPVYFESFGVRDPGSTQPMTTDTILRLYSMSKPITSVAAIMLVDDGRLRLDDPLSKYIPVFADVKVGMERADASGNPWLTLEPLKRPITIEDLLRHTSGMTYGFSGGATTARTLQARTAGLVLALRCELRSHPIPDCRSANTAGQAPAAPSMWIPGTICPWSA